MRTFEKFIVEAEGFQGKMTPNHNARKGAIAVKNMLGSNKPKPQKSLPSSKGSAIVPTGKERTSREAVGKVTANPGVRHPGGSSGPTKTPNMNPKPTNGFKSKPGLGTTLGGSTTKGKGDSLKDKVSQAMRSRKAAQQLKKDAKSTPTETPKPTAGPTSRPSTRSDKDVKSNGSGSDSAYQRQLDRERAKEDYEKGTHHGKGKGKKPGIRAGLSKGALGDWSRQGKFDMAKKVGTAARNAPGNALKKVGKSATDFVKSASKNAVKDVDSVEGKEGKSAGRMQKQY